jgi:hypothetical protein
MMMLTSNLQAVPRADGILQPIEQGAEGVGASGDGFEAVSAGEVAVSLRKPLEVDVGAEGGDGAGGFAEPDGGSERHRVEQGRGGLS